MKRSFGQYQEIWSATFMFLSVYTYDGLIEQALQRQVQVS